MAMKARWLIVSAVVTLLLGGLFAVTVWPTLYRYEVKYRCVYEPITEPFENEFSGQVKPPASDIEKFLWRSRKDAGSWLRIARMKIIDEQYHIHRITGDIYRLEKGRWVLQGRLFEKPEEILDSYDGKAPNGCWRSPDSVTQDAYRVAGPWGLLDKKREEKKQ